MADDKRLDTYRGKRDFRRTDEPDGCADVSHSRPMFVIQAHDASHMHYDFRLEIDGVLKSWAIPKGPSTDPREKRLAIQTENHPLSYANFEGTIAADQYGGGTVQVWDAGWYSNLTTDDDGDNTVSMVDAHVDGHITVWLHGKKLRGGYALTRFREEHGKAQWLLLKMDDDEADARRKPVSTQTRSVLSGRNLDTIAADDDHEA